MTGPDRYAVDMLFGEVPFGRLAIDSRDQEPWHSFAAARREHAFGNSGKAVRMLSAIGSNSDIESRHRLLAWSLVRELGGEAPTSVDRQVLGVIVEVGMKDGCDLLAAYSDRTARYYNFSGAAMIWLRPDASLDTTVEAVLGAARNIVSSIDPWRQPRRPAPADGAARLNILTPSGVHFGEGSILALSRDAAAGPLWGAATSLLVALTSLPRTESTRLKP